MPVDSKSSHVADMAITIIDHLILTMVFAPSAHHRYKCGMLLFLLPSALIVVGFVVCLGIRSGHCEVAIRLICIIMISEVIGSGLLSLV